MIEVRWSIFRDFVNQKKAHMECIEANDTYYLYAFSGPMFITCALYKLEPSDDLTEFEASYKAACNKPRDTNGYTVQRPTPFAGKMVEDHKLFRRKHGTSISSPAGQTANLDVVIPYTRCKVNKAELIGCSMNDSVNLKVLDNAQGSISGTGIPNVLLNQFGFNVRMPDGYYTDKSEYDADLYQGMIVRIEYTNNSANTVTISVNVTLHQMVAI
jgi:hypothetical protein